MWNFLQQVGDAIVSGAKKVGDAVASGAKDAGDAIISGFNTLLGAAGSAAASLASGLAGFGKAVLGAAVGAGGTIISTVTGLLGAAGRFLSGIFAGITQIGADVENVVDQVFPPVIVDQPILDQPARSRPHLNATAMSIAPVADADSYRDSGRRYLFELKDGKAQFGTPDTPRDQWRTIEPAISYERKRLGEPIADPPLDMIGANAGRVFAKEKEKFRFYLGMLDHMFLRNPDEWRPSIYFKLDPGRDSPDNSDLLKPFAGVPADHPAVIRFPFFRRIAQTGGQGSVGINVDKHLAGWHRIDPRPPVDGGDPPPFTYFPPPALLVTYQQGLRTHRKLGLPVEKVLDVGVGHEHWHELGYRIYGGEMDSLDGPGLPPVLIERDVYRFFNGPIDDKGGFIDGTVNYYLLAQLHNDIYGILWMDEQAVFSERWRLLHPDDCVFGLFPTVVPSAVVQYLQRTPTYHTIGFDRTKYWCPFRDRLIRDESRMAVSRQVIVVSGIDPEGLQWRLYSINFSFGTCDRTWRWRHLPPPISPADADVRTNCEGAPPPYVLGLREDMTLYVHQTARDRQPWVSYQYYLPCDCRMTPDWDTLKLPEAMLVQRPTDPASLARVAEMMIARVTPTEVRNGPMPKDPYPHPWNALPEPVWNYVHEHYSHFGCYENVVSWRSQYYKVELPEGYPPELTEDDRLTNAEGRLRIRQLALNWDLVNPIIEDPAALLPTGILADFAAALPGLLTGNLSRQQLLQLVEDLKSSQFAQEWHDGGIFQPSFRLKLLNRPPLGYLLVHWDKRDDDLLPFHPFSGLHQKDNIAVVLRTDHGDTFPVVLREWHPAMYPPAVKQVQVTLRRGVVTIRFLPATPLPDGTEIAVNIWRVKVGALTGGGAEALGPATVLLSALRHEVFEPELDGSGWLRFEWHLDQESPEVAQRARAVCTQRGRDTVATSVWFEDVVGHIRLPDQTEFLTAA